jgi:hypothetical protein
MGDKTWGYEFTSSPWSQKQTPLLGNTLIHPLKKKLKIDPSEKKAMMAAFWDCEGLLLCELFPPKTTINSNKCCDTLKKLWEAIK